uniref:P-loop containing nucleoside triphosphate hydrolase protein n=1 Tax=Moniliophthora roreri TaxID=221103 RepID=A0A0W0FN82_MONRR
MSFWNLFRRQRQREDSKEREAAGDTFLSKHISSHGGPLKFRLQCLRVCLCITLLCLASTIQSPSTIPLIGTFAYATFLSFAVVVSPATWSSLSAKHVNAVLSVCFAVYAYRDLFPLATFDLVPLDVHEGDLLWWKIGVLGVAMLLPLFMPRQYRPVDPQKPSPEPHPEQTVSPFNFMCFFFVDSIIFLASWVSHVSVDQMPPLADYDAAEHLRKKSSSNVAAFGGAQKHHIFWSLLRLVRRDYIHMIIMVVVHTFGKFAVPLSVNQLLRYLESGRESTFIRPWFWIAMIFVGPNVASLSVERYMFLALRSLARINSILTQMIFSHALQIRVKAEAPSIRKSPPPTVAAGSESEVEVDQDPVQAEQQEEVHTAVTQAPEVPEAEKRSSLIGKINNLVTTDVNNILNGPHLPYLVSYVPLQLAFSLVFLYSILGWSAFVAFGCTILLLPVPGYLAGLTFKIHTEKMKRTDERVEVVSESGSYSSSLLSYLTDKADVAFGFVAMKVLRMVKLFGWEDKMSRLIAEKREQELKWIKRYWWVQLLTQIINFLIPVITMVACYFTLYVPCFFSLLSVGSLPAVLTVIMKQELKASVVFASITVFDYLRTQCTFMVQILGKLIASKVSLDRINNFLVQTEVLDVFSSQHSDLESRSNAVSEIGVHDALFTWSNEVHDNPLAYGERFVLSVEGSLHFKRGCLNLIVGPTGSGKTSLLMALLGEMHFIPIKPDSYVNLPREGGLAYAAQESWVQNDTVRQNILFGSPFDEDRYRKVLYQCGLERDLTLFDAGDKTEVGEKGITLSGGQKARITLARAVYSSAEILLLDDVLAALDVHTAKWIVDKCLRGELMKGRTVILVTHNVPLTAPLAEFVITVKDGKVTSTGTIDAVMEQYTAVSEVKGKVERTDKEGTPASPNDDKSKPDGKLIVAEEIQMGRVGFSAVKLYMSAFGGSHAGLVITVYIVGLLVSGALNVAQTWYLGYWATQYELLPSSEVLALRHFGVYGLILVVTLVASGFTYAFFSYSAVRASRTIHTKLVHSVLGTTLRWLDMTPVSRVLTRCTQDISAVDIQIPSSVQEFGILATKMITQLAALMIYTPIFVIPGILVAEMSNAKAPVLAQFETAIAGIVSIRAYGASDAFEQELRRRIDLYTRISRTLFNLGRWMATRVEFLGAAFSSALAAYLVYYNDPGASGVGFSLNMAVTFSGAILFFIFYLNDLEMNANSLERIDGYLNIEQEPTPNKAGIPPAYWPASGDLRVENLSARYSSDGPRILHNLSFHIRSGERIGVVGRTGSGKSSLTLSLLRCILTEGNVYYDGLNTSTINLDALRSSITIIPQMPELLSGSLRQNLDPFGQHDDATLNDVLRSSGLFELQKTKNEGRITLDTGIASGGTNLSVGQRQIIALARAILRKSKLLILDEATSAIDYETDTVIQQSLRHELSGDVTVITIAHRLQTIMDADRIMVLDAGEIVEFDSPKELLKNNGSLLKALVDESADREVLVRKATGVTDIQCLCSSSSFVSSVVQCAATVCTPEELASGQQALENTCDAITGTGTSTGTGTFTGTLSGSSTFPPLSSTGTGVTISSTITPITPPTTTATETETAPPVTQTTGTTPPPLPTLSTSPRPTSGLGQTTDQQGQPTGGASGSNNGNNGAVRYHVAGAGYLVGMAVLLLML